MDTSFIYKFLQSVDISFLHKEGRKYLDSFSYTNEANEFIKSLENKLDSPEIDPIDIQGIHNQIEIAYTDGDRLYIEDPYLYIPPGGTHSVFSEALIEPHTYDWFIWKKAKEIIDTHERVLYTNYRKFIEELSLSGYSKEKKVEVLDNLFTSANAAIFGMVEKHTLIYEIPTYILSILEKLTNQIIKEFEILDVTRVHRYDVSKIEDYLRKILFTWEERSNPISTDERDFLLISHTSYKGGDKIAIAQTDLKIGSIDPVESEAFQTFEQFIADTRKLYEITTSKGVRVFDKDSYRRLFELIRSHKNGEPLGEKLNINTQGLTKGEFGEKFTFALQKEMHFEGGRKDFENFVIKALLWRGQEITSTASFRNKGYNAG